MAGAAQYRSLAESRRRDVLLKLSGLIADVEGSAAAGFPIYGGRCAVADAPAVHDLKMAHRARSSGLLILSLAIIVVPAWGGFDYSLVPKQAHTFLLLRLAADIPLLGLWWLLWARPVGQRRPELLTCAGLAVIQAEIAWMVVRAHSARDFYLLGFSLPLYASGCVMGGRPRWTVAVIATSWLALGGALLGAPAAMSGSDLAASTFYLSTASVIGIIGHVQRDRLSSRELVARERLEREQIHTTALMKQLERLSQEDSLTGLANRRRWDSQLTSACTRTRNGGPPLAVLLIDIDRFKTINDEHGHAAGDETLRHVAELVTRHVRGSDLVARLGGDEYGVLLCDTDGPQARTIAEQLRLRAGELSAHRHGGLSLSIGVAAAVGEEAQADQLMTRADTHLYRAKTTRNAVAI